MPIYEFYMSKSLDNSIATIIPMYNYLTRLMIPPKNDKFNDFRKGMLAKIQKYSNLAKESKILVYATLLDGRFSVASLDPDLRTVSRNRLELS